MAKCGLCGDVDGDGIITINDAKLQWDFETGTIPISDLACPQYRLWAVGEINYKFKKLDDYYNGTQMLPSPYQAYKNSYLFDNVLNLINLQQVPSFPEVVQTPYGRLPDYKNYINTINTELEKRDLGAGTIDCCSKNGALYKNLVNSYSYMGFNKKGQPNILKSCCERCKEGSVLNENDPCFSWCDCCDNNNNISNGYNSEYNYLQSSIKPNISNNEFYIPGKFHLFKNMDKKGGDLVCSNKGTFWAATLDNIDADKGNSPGLDGWQKSNQKLFETLGYPMPGRWIRFEHVDPKIGVICRKYMGRINVTTWDKSHSSSVAGKTDILNLETVKPIFKSFQTCEQCMDTNPQSSHNYEITFSWCDFYENNKALINELNCKEKCYTNIDPTDPCFKFCNCFRENKIMKMKR